MINTNLLLIFVILVVGGYGWYEYTHFLNERLAYSDFRETSAAKALKQKEEHDEQISVAMAERDASIARMRDSQIRSKSLQSSLATALSRGTCQDSATDHAALSGFFTEIEGYIIEADTTVINVKAWAAAWPTP